MIFINTGVTDCWPSEINIKGLKVIALPTLTVGFAFWSLVGASFCCFMIDRLDYFNRNQESHVFDLSGWCFKTTQYHKFIIKSFWGWRKNSSKEKLKGAEFVRCTKFSYSSLVLQCCVWMQHCGYCFQGTFQRCVIVGGVCKQDTGLSYFKNHSSFAWGK